MCTQPPPSRGDSPLGPRGVFWRVSKAPKSGLATCKAQPGSDPLLWRAVDNLYRCPGPPCLSASLPLLQDAWNLILEPCRQKESGIRGFKLQATRRPGPPLHRSLSEPRVEGTRARVHTCIVLSPPSSWPPCLYSTSCSEGLFFRWIFSSWGQRLYPFCLPAVSIRIETR